MPAWVSEGSVQKYHRAVKFLKDSNQEVTDEAVKALYTKYGGLVLDEAVDEQVKLEDLGIRELRKMAKARNIETDGVEHEDLIAALRAA